MSGLPPLRSFSPPRPGKDPGIWASSPSAKHPPPCPTPFPELGREPRCRGSQPSFLTHHPPQPETPLLTQCPTGKPRACLLRANMRRLFCCWDQVCSRYQEQAQPWGWGQRGKGWGVLGRGWVFTWVLGQSRKAGSPDTWVPSSFRRGAGPGGESRGAPSGHLGPLPHSRRGAGAGQLIFTVINRVGKMRKMMMIVS